MKPHEIPESPESPDTYIFYRRANIGLPPIPLRPADRNFLAFLSGALEYFPSLIANFKSARISIITKVQDLVAFADRLLFQLGVNLTLWLSNCLPEDIAGDLCEIHRELTSDGKPSLMVLLCVLYEAILMLWGFLMIALQDMNSDDEQLYGYAIAIAVG